MREEVQEGVRRERDGREGEEVDSEEMGKGEGGVDYREIRK